MGARRPRAAGGRALSGRGDSVEDLVELAQLAGAGVVDEDLDEDLAELAAALRSGRVAVAFPPGRWKGAPRPPMLRAWW